MIIAKVVQSNPVKDMKMLEISTEEIIRNIYQEGISNE
jgi:ABC-2 type transport system ATP-binding protein